MPAWPPGWTRTPRPRRAAFKPTTIAAAMHALLYETKRLSAADVKVDHDLRLRNDGMPYSQQRQPDDRGVVAYFTLPDGKKVAMPCDRWDLVEHNLLAIARTLEAKRAVERWGCSTMAAEYEGYKALPAGDAAQAFGTAPPPGKSPREVLGVRDDASLDACEGAYRAQAKQAHPDRPGVIHPAGGIEHHVALVAQRTGVRVPCPIHGVQVGLTLPGQPDPARRICEACWAAVAARVQPFAELLMACVPTFYPDGVHLPVGYEAWRAHLAGGWPR